MERNTITFPVRVICLCCIYALPIAVFITGVITEKLWIGLIAFSFFTGQIVYFRTRQKKVLSDYFHRKKLSKRNRGNQTS